MNYKTIGAIILNPSKHYDGDLKHYFQVVFEKARNLSNPYHNFRHIFHVTYLCYLAIIYYGDKITSREARALLIAAMFHDFNHPGKTGNDDLNIEFALRGLRGNLLEEDKELLPLIEDMILSTEFPPKKDRPTLTLLQQIICDADVSQAMSVAWIQQIIFGLAGEMSMTSRQVLEMQGTFLGSLKFQTEWANEMFPKASIDEKIAEAKELLDCLAV